jgi:NAD-dependent deacetylase
MSAIEVAVGAIRALRPRRIAVLTGAGISAESGIPTFRGAGGLWNEYRIEELATPEGFARDPLKVWEWYEWRRTLIREAQPNPAHRALARIEDAPIITQNIDGLHALAGSTDVVELHGNIFRVRCVREGVVHDHREPFETLPPSCGCGGLLRPDVVWFGEVLPEDAIARAVSAIRAADLMIVIGTSGVVYPAAGLIALHEGLSIEVNPELASRGSVCMHGIESTATDAVPRLVDAFLESRR